MSRTVKVVKVNPILHKPTTITRRQICFGENIHCPAYLGFNYHNCRSNQSALMTRFGTDLRHQYGIFGDESQMSFTRNATLGQEQRKTAVFAGYIPWVPEVFFLVGSDRIERRSRKGESRSDEKKPLAPTDNNLTSMPTPVSFD